MHIKLSSNNVIRNTILYKSKVSKLRLQYNIYPQNYETMIGWTYLFYNMKFNKQMLNATSNKPKYQQLIRSQMYLTHIIHKIIFFIINSHGPN